MSSFRPGKIGQAVLVGILVLVLAVSSGLAQAQEQLPTPTKVVAQDDEEDDSGTRLLVRWQAPEQTGAAEGYILSGYHIYLIGREPELAAQVEPATTEAVLDKLKPGQQYVVQVAATYSPRQAAAVPAEVVEALSQRSAPAAPIALWYNANKTNVLVVMLIYCAIVLLAIYFARRGEMYIRPIPGLEAVNDAIGRATEMGRPILYISGLSGISDIATIAAMLILGHLSKRTAAYETPIIVPCNDPLVMTAEREIVHQAYIEAGKPDAYESENIFYVTDSQFGYAAAVDGIMMREKPAANFFMGMFYAEALVLAETGNMIGAIQIAGTDADTQLPFFITACDYTLMGEELYAAGAYLSRNPLLVAQLKGQDAGKVLLVVALVAGTVLATVASYAAPELFETFQSWFQIHG